MKADLCKFHEYEHVYARCQCGHLYCPFYWRACPRCHGTEPNNRMILNSETDQEKRA